MLSYVFSSIIEISLVVSAFILFFTICIPKRLVRYSPKCRSFLWIILAVRLLIPIQPRFRVAALQLTAPYQLSSQIQVTSSSHNVSQYSFMQIMAFVWLMGVILFWTFHIVSYKYFEEKLNKGRKTIKLTKEQTEQLRNVFYETKYSMGNYDSISLWISSQAAGPMMIGFFHPKVVIPDCMIEPNKLSMIFRHELTHYQRKDSWYRFVLLSAESLHWFNPFVHLMAHRSADDIEGACDCTVVQGKDEDFVNSYIHALLDTARSLLKKKNPHHQTALVSYFSSSAGRLKKRFIELMIPQKKNGTTFLTLCAVLVVFSTCFIFIQSNDQNLEWARSLSEGDISAIEFSNHRYLKKNTALPFQTKHDIVYWFGKNGFKPSFYHSKNRTEEERFRITKNDGSEKTVSIFSDGSVRVGGKEYRAYNRWFGNEFKRNSKMHR